MKFAVNSLNPLTRGEMPEAGTQEGRTVPPCGGAKRASGTDENVMLQSIKPAHPQPTDVGKPATPQQFNLHRSGMEWDDDKETDICVVT